MRVRLAAGVALCALATVSLASCILPARLRSHSGAPPAARLRIVGSDTMAPLARRLAQDFMWRNPGVSVYAEGGGTATGIRALIAGETDLCTASRTLTADETRELIEKRGSLGIRILCARDALSIYLNHENPVADLTLEQVRGLLSGRIAVWSEVGGPDAPVRVYVREPNSGTRGFLQEQVLLGEPFAPGAIVCKGTWALADAVAGDPAGIGFGGLVFGEQVRHCRINGVAPTPDRVRDGSYPIARYLYLYAVDTPRGVAEAFVDFVLSPEGQALVEEMGYVPLWDAR